MPGVLETGRHRVLLRPGAKLPAHQVYGNSDIDTVVGSVIQNPNNPNILGIRNEGKDNWTYIKPDGTQIPVAPGRTAAAARGAKIDFGRNTGTFK